MSQEMKSIAEMRPPRHENHCDYITVKPRFAGQWRGCLSGVLVNRDTCSRAQHRPMRVPHYTSSADEAVPILAVLNVGVIAAPMLAEVI